MQYMEINRKNTMFIIVTGSAKTLHSHTSNFTTLTSHSFKSIHDITLKLLYAVE